MSWRHPFDLSAAVDGNPFAGSTSVSGPTTGVSFSLLYRSIVSLIEVTCSFAGTLNIIAGHSRERLE